MTAETLRELTIALNRAEQAELRAWAAVHEIEARLATAEADVDGWKAQAIEEMDHVEQIAARLRAAERGLQIARDHGENWNLNDWREWWTLHCSRKAYSSQPFTDDSNPTGAAGFSDLNSGDRNG